MEILRTKIGHGQGHGHGHDEDRLLDRPPLFGGLPKATPYGRRSLPVVGHFVIRHWQVLAVLLIAPATARAHRLDGVAWLDPGGVRVVARYPDGAPAAGATVLVFVRGRPGEGDDNFRGPPLFQDKLDREGTFLFMPDAPRDLLCVIDDGVGHRAELEIHGKDLLVLLERSPEAATKRTPQAPPRPIAVSNRRLSMDDFPLWTRITAGLLTIALATILSSWLVRSRRRHAP